MRRDLIERARQGDHDAFSELAIDSVHRLFVVARLILRDDARAEDATQEALVSAWTHIGALRDPDRFDAWLRRMLVNACYREARLRRLNTDQRAVLVLHYYLGLSLDEAAEVLGVPPGTVRSRLHRAMVALRAAPAADAETPLRNEGWPA